jgi:hypothetical protein
MVDASLLHDALLQQRQSSNALATSIEALNQSHQASSRWSSTRPSSARAWQTRPSRECGTPSAKSRIASGRCCTAMAS